MAHDSIFESWLIKQKEDAAALNAASDDVRVDIMDDRHFMVAFSSKCLVKSDAGSIEEVDGCLIGIAFSQEYLRRFNPAETICLFHPRGVFHPNVFQTAICPGRMSPGSGLVDLVGQVFDILTFKTMNLRDPLNREAAEWARDRQHLFPIDRRPLRRRKLDLQIEEVVRP
jgi:hypothetical protein